MSWTGRFLAAGLIAILLAAPGALAGDMTPELQVRYKGIVLAGVPATRGGNPDTTYLGLKEGLNNIAKAIDVIYAKSRFSAEKIETLKKNGDVVLVYYPSYQEGRIGSFALASFFPDFFKKNDKDSKDGGAKKFMVVVGPHAVKWPADELAMIIVHELVGHGIQHLRGRLEYIRVLDLECAANLYGENFYQDLGIDKKSDDVVTFRKNLEQHWCSDFKTYMRNNNPSQLALWDVLNPDVHRLLEIFDDYVNDLRKQGVSGRAIELAKKLQQANAQEWIRKVESEGSPSAQLAVGIAFRDGMGVEQDHVQAVKWFRKAAESGYAQAQYLLGAMYFRGDGVDQDEKEAARWYRLAAEQGNPYAQAQLGVMSVTGHGLPEDSFLANFWLTLAKSNYPSGNDRNFILKVWRDTAKKLSPEQLGRVKKLTRQWRAKHSQPQNKEAGKR